MTRNAQDIIDNMRNIVKPSIANILLEFNFDGRGKEDKAEFETEFEMILTLAEMGLKNPCGDTISRKDVYDLIATWLSDYLTDETREVLETVNGKIEDLSSVEPSRPHGEWINQETWMWGIGAECSACHKRSSGRAEDTGWGHEYFLPEFCPKCGADMRGDKK